MIFKQDHILQLKFWSFEPDQAKGSRRTIRTNIFYKALHIYSTKNHINFKTETSRLSVKTCPGESHLSVRSLTPGNGIIAWRAKLNLWTNEKKKRITLLLRALGENFSLSLRKLPAPHLHRQWVLGVRDCSSPIPSGNKNQNPHTRRSVATICSILLTISGRYIL